MNLDADAVRDYEAAQERTQLLSEEWERLSRPFFARGSMGQEVIHPLIPAMNAAERHADALRRPLMKKHRGPAPSAVVSTLAERRITPKSVLPAGDDAGRADVGGGDDERARVAYHEAGHAVAAFLLGGRITGPVSIERKRRWNGIAHARGPRYPVADGERFDPAQPAVLAPARLRRSLESDAMVFLAGSVAEGFRPSKPRSGYSASDGDGERSARLVVSSLTRADAKYLASGDDESLPPIPKDLEQANEVADILAGERAAALLNFLHAEVAALLSWPAAQRRLHRLAEALLEHGTLGAATVRKLLKEA